MTVQEFLRSATHTLQQADIESARLDTLVLLEDALGRDRAIILAYPEAEIESPTEVELNKKVAQRSLHTPLAYIRGKAEFYGRTFRIAEGVLVPRPETETMIDLLKKLSLPDRPQIVDIGTGSGCIGITVSLELPNAKVELSDIDKGALEIATQNAQLLKADVACLPSDLLTAMPNAHVVLANLPYVPERYAINQAAEHEPKHAIFGGKDGLNLYRRLWEQIPTLPHKPMYVLTEALPPQHSSLVELARTAGYRVHAAQDFIQVFTLA